MPPKRYKKKQPARRSAYTFGKKRKLSTKGNKRNPRFNATPKGLADIRDAKEELGVSDYKLSSIKLKANLEAEKRRIEKHLAKYLYQLENGIGLRGDVPRVGIPHGYTGHVKRVTKTFTVVSNANGYLAFFGMPHQCWTAAPQNTKRLIGMYSKSGYSALDNTTNWSYANFGPGTGGQGSPTASTTMGFLFDDTAATSTQNETGTVIVPQRCVSYQVKIIPVGAASLRSGTLTAGEVPMHTQTSGFKKNNLTARWERESHELAVAQVTDGIQICWHPKWTSELEYVPRAEALAAPDPNMASNGHYHDGPPMWSTTVDQTGCYAPQLYIFGESLGANQPFLIQLEYVFEVAHQQQGYSQTSPVGDDGQHNDGRNAHHPQTYRAAQHVDSISGQRGNDPSPAAAADRAQKVMDSSKAFL